MVREVRGAGTLKPEEIRSISTTATGRVERFLQAGAVVKPDTIIVELSNPDLKQQVGDAELAWKAAVAQYDNAKANQKTNRTSLEFAVADAKAAEAVAESDLNANLQLFKEGLVADQQIKVKQATVAQAKNRMDLAQKQLESAIETEKSQLAPQEAAVSQARARFDQQSRQQEPARPRQDDGPPSGRQRRDRSAGQSGVSLARVSDPSSSKPRSGFRNPDGISPRPNRQNRHTGGTSKGHVSRIARPQRAARSAWTSRSTRRCRWARGRPERRRRDQLQRLENVLYVESPTFGQENTTISCSRLTRTTTRFARR